MLTKQDLNAIGNLMDVKLEIGLKPLRQDVKDLNVNVASLQKNVTIVKTGVKKLRKDLNTTIEFFDKNDHILLNKLNKTRSEVGLSELNFA